VSAMPECDGLFAIFVDRTPPDADRHALARRPRVGHATARRRRSRRRRRAPRFRAPSRSLSPPQPVTTSISVRSSPPADNHAVAQARPHSFPQLSPVQVASAAANDSHRTPPVCSCDPRHRRRRRRRPHDRVPPPPTASVLPPTRVRWRTRRRSRHRQQNPFARHAAPLLRSGTLRLASSNPLTEERRHQRVMRPGMVMRVGHRRPRSTTRGAANQSQLTIRDSLKAWSPLRTGSPTTTAPPTVAARF